MAQVLPTNRYIVALGPIKAEIMNFSGTITDSTGSTQTGVDDADTIASNLANPSFAVGSITSDAVTISESVNIAISGKTLTVNSTDLAADNLVVIVFGF